MTKRKEHTKTQATRRQLLDATLCVIGEKGYSAATVDEIVEAAGVSKGLAYYHFKNKAEMAQSVLEEGVAAIISEFEHIAKEAPSSPAALTGMIEHFASYLYENGAFGRFFVSELWREGRAWSESLRGFEQRLLNLLEEQLARGQAEGYIRSEIDTRFEAVALVGMVVTTALYYVVPDALEVDCAAEAGAMPGGDAAGDAEDAPSTQTLDKDAFIERIVDFVRHANARPELLYPSR